MQLRVFVFAAAVHVRLCVGTAAFGLGLGLGTRQTQKLAQRRATARARTGTAVRAHSGVPPDSDGKEEGGTSPSRLALVSVTLGLEDLAADYLVDQGIVRSAEDLRLLPRPEALPLGQAALAQFIVRLAETGSAEETDQAKAAVGKLLRAPVVQSVVAFLGEEAELGPGGGWVEDADGWADVAPTGALDQVCNMVRDSAHWPTALELLGFIPATFRASCVFSASADSRVAAPMDYGGRDVEMAMGGAVMQSQGWEVDLYNYDVEVYGFFWQGRFTCGILLGGEWRPNMKRADYKFSVAPFCEAHARPYNVQVQDDIPWYMPKLRPSTALLLLLLSGVRDGDVVLDPMGGSGTIAIEAAAHFDVNATSSDNDRATTAAAVRNVVQARPHLRGRCVVRDLDATKIGEEMTEGSVDRLVADTPFGQRCRWLIRKELPLLLDSIATVLSPAGRAVLLMKGYRRLEDLLANQTELRLVERREVNIGGFLCYALVLAHAEETTTKPN